MKKQDCRTVQNKAGISPACGSAILNALRSLHRHRSMHAWRINQILTTRSLYPWVQTIWTVGFRKLELTAQAPSGSHEGAMTDG